MKLEVGMYVRTPYGIRKIVNITKDAGYKARVKVIEFDRLLSTAYKMDYIFYTDEHTIKNSKARHKIIDLIEVGDYVNGFEVQSIDKNEKTVICYTATFFEDEIETIVTKEQFSSVSYEVSK